MPGAEKQARHFWHFINRGASCFPINCIWGWADIIGYIKKAVRIQSEKHPASPIYVPRFRKETLWAAFPSVRTGRTGRQEVILPVFSDMLHRTMNRCLQQR